MWHLVRWLPEMFRISALQIHLLLLLQVFTDILPIPSSQEMPHQVTTRKSWNYKLWILLSPVLNYHSTQVWMPDLEDLHGKVGEVVQELNLFRHFIPAISLS